MFEVTLGTGTSGKRDLWQVLIEGCPADGIAAIDFRVAHGLGAAPTAVLNLPPYAVYDEEFVRSHADKADHNADLHFQGPAGKQEQYVLFKEESPRPRQVYGSNRYLSPAVAKAYLEAQNKETARAVYLDLWGYGARSKARAEQELLDMERAREEARALLAGELEQLHAELKLLRQQVAHLRKRRDAEDRAEEQDAADFEANL